MNQSQIEKELDKLMEKFAVLESDTAEVYFSFPKDFIGFKGHFPNNPILPGICIIKAFLVQLKVWKEKTVHLKE